MTQYSEPYIKSINSLPSFICSCHPPTSSNPSRLKIIDCSFYHQAPALWNSLPQHLRALSSTSPAQTSYSWVHGLTATVGLSGVKRDCSIRCSKNQSIFFQMSGGRKVAKYQYKFKTMFLKNLENEVPQAQNSKWPPFYIEINIVQ